MKRLLCFVLPLVACLMLPWHVLGQDGQYIRIYELIQQADALNNASQAAEARAKYEQAHAALQSFQRVYPNWNTKVVSFRLTYLETKINALAVKPPVAAPTAGSLPVRPTDADRQLAALRDQIRQLETEKIKLEAKLKEAFESQMAGPDPRELSNAQWRIESLTQENARLKGGSANEPAAAAETKALEEVRQALTDANRKLTDQMARANSLEAEKKELLGRLDNLALMTNDVANLAVIKTELAKASRQLADKSAATETLARERDALQARVQALQDQLSSMPVLTNPPMELVSARQALDEARKELTRQSGSVDRLTLERDALQTRLEKAVATQSNVLADLDTTRLALDSANQQLTDQSAQTDKLRKERDQLQANVQALMDSAAAADALRAEREILRQQLAAAKVAADQTAEQGRKLAVAEARLASLQSQAGVLHLEKTALENRMKVTPVVAAEPVPAKAVSRPEDLARIRQLELERDYLQNKLEAAGQTTTATWRPITAAPSNESDLVAQVAGMRARLAVLEARSVPYTPEELGLFAKSSTQPMAANTRSGSAAVNRLPAGTATLVAEAQKDFSARRFDQAEAKYLEVLRRDRNNVYTLANLAAIQLEMNHLDAAQQHIERAVAIAPDDGYSLSVLGFLRFRQGRYDDALDALSRAAGFDPENAQVQNYLGVTLSHKGLRGPAETALRKALQIDPNYADAHNNLAVIYATQRPPLQELARWHYQKALAAGLPHNVELEKLLNKR